MDEKQCQQQRHDQTQADQRPGHASLAGMQMQQEQAGDAEHQRRHGEDVQEPAPGCAAVAAFVQVVEVGNPAAIGAFEFNRATGTINAEPGIRTGTRHGQVDFLFRPFRRSRANGNTELVAQPVCRGRRQGRVAFIALAQALQQFRRQFRGQVDHLRFGLDTRGVVEGDAGGGKQQHADQAHRRTDPVPLVQRT